MKLWPMTIHSTVLSLLVNYRSRWYGRQDPEALKLVFRKGTATSESGAVAGARAEWTIEFDERTSV